MKLFFKLCAIALPLFLLIDGIWLTLIAKNLYAQQLGFLLKTDVNWLAAILFYLLFVVGLVVFVITPALRKKSLQTALVLGGLFGLISYATYDLTNLATVKDWPLLITIIDMLWGTFLGSTVCTLSYLVAKQRYF